MSLSRRLGGTSTPLAVGLALVAACLLTACGGGGGDGGANPPAATQPAFVPNPFFGSAGVVTTTGSRPSTLYRHADVIGDGSMALLGHTLNGMGTFGFLLIEKRLPDGSVDASFGTAGQVEFGATPQYTAKGVALNGQDGSVVVVADRSLSGYTLLKILSNGAPDAGFGIGGVTDVITPDMFKVAGMVVEADGRIVVAGFTNGSGYLMRHLSTGAADPGWNGGAPYTFQIFSSNTYVTALARRAGGGYLVAGKRTIQNKANGIFVGRFGTNGLPVAGFGSAGFLIYAPGFSTDVRGIVARPGGEAVVYGLKKPGSTFALGVTDTGGVDASFGLRELDAPLHSGVIAATHRYSDGAITIGMRTGTESGLTLWRLRPDGSSDPDFGDAGLSVVPLPSDVAILQFEPYLADGFLALGYRSVLPGFEGYLLHLIPE